MASSNLNSSSGLRSMESSHRSLTVLRCKLCVVGDAAVGKTSLTQVFQSGGSNFPKNYMMTVGADFVVKQVPIPDTNIIVELYIFDCAGQAIFNQLDMNAKYYDGAAAVMIVFDIGSNESLRSANKWLTAVRAGANVDSLLTVLVGNKADYRDGSADSRAEVVKEDAQRCAKELNAKYFEVSAIANTDVTEPFAHIAREFYQRYEETLARGDEMRTRF